MIATTLAFVGALGLASQAGAAAQIGAAAPGSLALPANTTAMQFGAQEPYFYASTYGSSAIITSWSTYGSGGTYQLKLKVGSAVATDEGIVRYESAMETVSGPGLQTFPARIRIFGNEQIGAYSPTGAPGFLQAMPLPVGDDPLILVGHIVILKAGDQLEPPGKAFGPWDGWTNPADIKKQPYRLSLAATIEPDADGDDFGDESQDKCLGVRGDVDGCAAPPRTPAKRPPYLKGRPIVKNGATTLVVVVPSAGRLIAQQADGGGGKKSSANLSAASAEVSAAKRRKGKGKGKRHRPSLMQKVAKRPKRAGPVRVKIKPTKLGRRVLSKRGKFTVEARIAFVAAGTKQRFSFTRKVIVKKGTKDKGKPGKGKGRDMSRQR